MIPMFTKLPVICIDASRIFGCSSRLTMRRKEGCFFVFRTLMSLADSEKKATSLPEIKNDNRKSMITENSSMVVAAGVMARNKAGAWFAKTEW